MRKKKKWWILLLIVLLLAGGAAWMRLKAPIEHATVSSYTVARGDVSSTITGSGKLEAQDTANLKIPTGVEIETIFVEVGDEVQSGDVLASLDEVSLRYRAAELSAELNALDKQLSRRDTISTIAAPVRGRIKVQQVAEDDDVVESVNEHGALCILSTDELMQVALETDRKLALNAEVTVRWNGGSEKGVVAGRTEKGYLITLDDEDAPYLAQADIYYDAALVGTGVLEIHAPLAVFGNGGTIETIHYDVDDEVNAGSKLYTLSNEPAVDDYRKTLADRNEKAEQLQKVLHYQNSPNVVADISGTVNAIEVEEGKKTQSADEADDVVAFTFGVGGATRMVVAVDELDISRVAAGQQATITLDAFASEVFEASVKRISRIDTASGSITTYETELVLAPNERLLDSMNGSAVILSDSAQDVLLIPLGAIHEDASGSYVYKLGADDVQIKTYVTTGLSDGTNAQVINGLAEGERIVYNAGRSNMMFPFGPAMRNGSFGGEQ